MRTYIHVSSGIRTDDLSDQAVANTRALNGAATATSRKIPVYVQTF